MASLAKEKEEVACNLDSIEQRAEVRKYSRTKHFSHTFEFDFNTKFDKHWPNAYRQKRIEQIWGERIYVFLLLFNKCMPFCGNDWVDWDIAAQ